MTGAQQRGRDRSAAEWFALMRGPDAAAEREAFEAWRSEIAHAKAYAEIEATWDESRFLAKGLAARDRNLSRARKRTPPAALVAAGVALVTLLSAALLAQQMGWVGAGSIRQPAAARIAAGDAVRTIRLADGSRVTLDRDAILSDLSTPTERRAVLLRGRARFDVAHDSARPFFVDAGDGRVLAHGTLFDVEIEAGGVRVALLEGSVEVLGRKAGAAERDGRRFLVPGEQLVVHAGSVGKPSPTTATALAWAEPMISFEKVPLAEAVAIFNKGGGRAVRVENEGISALRVSGAFRRDDPRGFADALAASFGLVVEQGADGSLVLHAGAADPSSGGAVTGR